MDENGVKEIDHDARPHSHLTPPCRKKAILKPFNQTITQFPSITQSIVIHNSKMKQAALKRITRNTVYSIKQN